MSNSNSNSVSGLSYDDRYDFNDRPLKKMKLVEVTESLSASSTTDAPTHTNTVIPLTTTTIGEEEKQHHQQTSSSTSPLTSSFAPSPSIPIVNEILSPYPDSPDWSYVNKKILAPMVRIGTLPMRLLAVELGCDIVYSEELIAKKLSQCVREERIDSNGRKWIIFRQSSNTNGKADLPVLVTYPGEPLVVQLGASNGEDALAAAKVVYQDVKAIDINCGCPKHFSLQGGMGAALLSKPDTLAQILTTLRKNIPRPITCKIRLKHSEEDTITLVRRIESCGVSAIAVHGRHIEDRPRHRALPERIKPIAEAIKIPLIYNGDCYYSHDIPSLQSLTGASSIMSARGAMWNPSLFKSDGIMLPVSTIVRRYLHIARDVENHFTNTKYCIMEMLKGPISASQVFKQVTRAKDYEMMEMALQDMEKEDMVMKGGKEYQVQLTLEDRPVFISSHEAVGASTSLSSSNVDSSSSLSSSSFSSSSVHPVAGREMTKKERRYQAKQQRKNREGRKADEEAAAAAAAAVTVGSVSVVVTDRLGERSTSPSCPSPRREATIGMPLNQQVE